MAQLKKKQKPIKAVVIVAIILIVINILLSGINMVPLKYRNMAVSFLTPDLTWDSKPSDIILNYGLPKNIGKVSDITGERDFNFNFVYDEKDVSLTVDNRGPVNNEIHRYYFTIDCKTPEEANKYFDKCHKKIMDLYKNEPNFEFEGTETETDYQFEDGGACSYVSTNENGVEKYFIIDEDGKQIPVEEADNIIQTKTKINNYDMLNTIGVNYSLAYHAGDSSITLYADILY